MTSSHDLSFFCTNFVCYPYVHTHSPPINNWHPNQYQSSIATHRQYQERWQCIASRGSEGPQTLYHFNTELIQSKRLSGSRQTICKLESSCWLQERVLGTFPVSQNQSNTQSLSIIYGLKHWVSHLELQVPSYPNPPPYPFTPTHCLSHTHRLPRSSKYLKIHCQF